MTDETILTNAEVVADGRVFHGTVVVRDGAIAEVAHAPSAVRTAQDLEGDFLLPGLVELHTDNLEKHFEPRPGVVWPAPLAAVASHDALLVGAGITTVCDAVRVGDYRDAGKRRFILESSVGTLRAARDADLFRADHLVHLRCEIADPTVVEMFEPFADEPLVRLVSLMDHTPGQRQWTDLSKFREYYRGIGMGEAEMDTLFLEQTELQARCAAEHRLTLVARCHERGIPLASHDDTTEDHVAEAHADGIAIAEFPTTELAARTARRHGLSVILGAPNIVRGVSHSGNVSARLLARQGLADVLSSDYVPASLLHAAFLLHAEFRVPLAAAVAMVTETPARLIGLDDRGRIAPGGRADLIRVRVVDGFPVVRAVWGAGRRLM